jgi:hypothetical protein
MQRFFMHLHNGTDEMLDPDGVDMSMDAVASQALAAARDCMAADLRDGEIDLRYRIDVHDHVGALVHTLPFSDAVRIIPEDE